ncbi:MAG: hypothetical protein CMQ43_02410 [Gammaproteobacteria bacterium]|nr:hypothetical protein [Gammaproteobacteria bacterium]|tara:strand:- start:5869 stop:6186 length:318 start_codon:yes stop_codon:yes gene_type:complete
MRKGDPNDLTKSFFRTNDRFFQVNGQWYFSAREGEIGPFRTRDQARREAMAYINARQASAAAPPSRAAAHQRSEPTVIPGYVYRSVLSMEQQVSTDRDLVLDLEE